MKLILGQGNPGKNYHNTRHNFGFMALDDFAKKQAIKWQNKAKWRAEIAELNLNNENILLVKPSCFYNLTGEVIRQIGDFYQIDFTQDLLVIHDDTALYFGTIRVRQKGTDGGNNGLKSIISHIGQDFWRLRIGSKNEKLALVGAADFVLGKISTSEAQEWSKISKEISTLITNFVSKSLVDTSLNALSDNFNVKTN